MAGRTVQISGIILKKEPSGELFFRLYLLSPTLGNVMAMLRRPKRNSKFPIPDLFDQTEMVLEQKEDRTFGFVKELKIVKQRRGLAKSFIALELACELANMLLKNTPKDTEVESTYQILERGLEAWEKIR